MQWSQTLDNNNEDEHNCFSTNKIDLNCFELIGEGIFTIIIQINVVNQLLYTIPNSNKYIFIYKMCESFNGYRRCEGKR